MRRFAALLALAALIGAVWLVWLMPIGDEPIATEPATEVTVRVGGITRTTLRSYVTAYGVIEPEPAGPNPAASARVAPSVPGVVVAVLRAEGQQVQRGDLLFQLDSRAADVAVEFAEKTLEREQQLLRIEGTSAKALQDARQQLDAARVQQELLRVRAPLAGTVTRSSVKPGEAVDLTTVMAEIVDLDRLVVSASVPSAELTPLETGQPAQVFFEGSAPPRPGSLDFISAKIDPQTGTAQVRVRLPAGSNLRPGQLATIRIVSGEHADILAVPVESVVRNESGASVIAIVEGDTARQKPVRTGLQDAGMIEIEADGLAPGMTVVTEGAYGLPAETKVRVVAD